MPKLELLIGMIGSGKSNYARKRAKENALVICFDDLTAMLHAEYRYESNLRDCYRSMEERLAYLALWNDRDAIIDRTHLTWESRKRWIEWAAVALKGSIVAVVFPIETPKIHAQRRFESDPRGRSYDDWLGVARHHHEQAMNEPLDISEGFAGIVREGVSQ